MAAKRKRGLDRGLDALINSNAAHRQHVEEVSLENDGDVSSGGQAQRPPRDGDLRHLPVELMQRLAASLTLLTWVLS